MKNIDCLKKLNITIDQNQRKSIIQKELIKNSKKNNIDKTIQSHLDPDNEVTKALQQAKDSADLANETNKVKLLENNMI